MITRQELQTLLGHYEEAVANKVRNDTGPACALVSYLRKQVLDSAALTLDPIKPFSESDCVNSSQHLSSGVQHP